MPKSYLSVHHDFDVITPLLLFLNGQKCPLLYNLLINIIAQLQWLLVYFRMIIVSCVTTPLPYVHFHGNESQFDTQQQHHREYGLSYNYDLIFGGETRESRRWRRHFMSQGGRGQIWTSFALHSQNWPPNRLLCVDVVLWGIMSHVC